MARIIAEGKTFDVDEGTNLTKFDGYFGDGEEFFWTPGQGLPAEIKWSNFVQ